ncbi:MAG: hypothetical protein ACKVIH_01620 [Burkholderiales bacterium]
MSHAQPTYRLTYAPAFLPCGKLIGEDLRERKQLTVTARCADSATHAAEQITGRLVLGCVGVAAPASQEVAA